MNDDYFKKVFAKNLDYYIKASGKKQKEVAKDLGFEPTTFNTWCVGKILPHSGKIQAIADYFGIEKTDLTEEHVEGISWVGVDEDERKVLFAYRKLSDAEKAIIRRSLGI